MAGHRGGRVLSADGLARGPRQAPSRGPDQGSRPTKGFIIGHFGLALTGLCIWIGFLGTGVTALAWVAVGLVILIAGLGMGVLAADLPEPGATRRGRLPVTVIAVHGTLATATILLVLLAAVGAG